MRTCRWVVDACILLGVGGIGPFGGCEGRDGVVGSIVVGVGQSVGIVGGFDGDLGLGVVLVLVQSIQGPVFDPK